SSRCGCCPVVWEVVLTDASQVAPCLRDDYLCCRRNRTRFRQPSAQQKTSLDRWSVERILRWIIRASRCSAQRVPGEGGTYKGVVHRIRCRHCLPHRYYQTLCVCRACHSDRRATKFAAAGCSDTKRICRSVHREYIREEGD